MQTKPEATIEDLYNAPDDGNYEIVDGRLVKMSPPGYWPFIARLSHCEILPDYEDRRGGEAMTDGVAYVVDLPTADPSALMRRIFRIPDEEQGCNSLAAPTLRCRGTFRA